MKFLSLVGMLVAGLLSQADAATVRNFKAGSWDASAHVDENGAFAHCAASATYKSGITVIFSITKNYQWAIAFTHPNWKYQEGETYPVAFTVDDMKPLSDRATAYTKSAVAIRLADSAELFRRFRQGRVLKVATARTVFEFNLTGTNEMLSALLDCAVQKGGLTKVPMASNPFAPAPQGKSPNQTPANDLALRAEATTLAANLLSAAGLSGYRLMIPAEVPQMKGHARWIISSAEAIGSIQIHPTMSKDDRRTLGGQLIADDAKVCKGRFASGSMPEQDGAMRVFTVCEESSGVISMYYFTLPRTAGGTYVVATGSFGGADNASRAKDTHEDFRNAAFQACDKSIGCKEKTVR